VKLPSERERELLDCLQLRELLADKRLCARFGVSRRTLVRLRARLRDEGQSLAQNAPATVHVLLLNADSTVRKRA
jgi:predicted DNA-binding transcriptional regulator YafY